jgi:hypothetical protein
MHDRFRGFIALAACLTLPWQCVPVHADDAAGNTVQLGGLLFGDVYTIASHHSAEGDGASGFVLRRGYLTANFLFSQAWRGRARIEVNQDGDFESYSFDTQLKDLYLARTANDRELVIGLSPTLTYDLIESIWGARYLMRTPMGLQGVPSRDTGITLKGRLTHSGSVSYRAMYGSGLEYANQGGGGDKLMGALTWRLWSGVQVDFYADHEKRTGETDRSTWQVFAGHRTGALRWGVQYSHQDRQNDPKLELASAFVVCSLRDKLSVIGRVDRLLEPSPRGDGIAYVPFDPTARATMVLAGLEYRFSEVFRLTPNVIWTTYDVNAAGVRPNDDLHLRLTLFLDLE